MDQKFYVRMLLAGLVIIGIWNALGKGQVLGWLGDWMERWPAFLSKPLGLCPPCMASVYGTMIWWLTRGKWDIWFPMFILALSGALVLVSRNLLKSDG